MNTENETGALKRKLTDNQLRALQIVAGIVSAIAMVAALYLPQRVFNVEPNDLLNYSFVVVFLIITFGRRSIENKYRLRLGLFSLSLMLGIFAGVILFVVDMFYSSEQNIALSEEIKTLILIGLVLLLIVGITIPAMRFFKRKSEGNLRPIRLPEEEPAEQHDEEEPLDRPMTLEEKIAKMTQEIDDSKPEE